jgi:hypothetical protein
MSAFFTVLFAFCACSEHPDMRGHGETQDK